MIKVMAMDLRGAAGALAVVLAFATWPGCSCNRDQNHGPGDDAGPPGDMSSPGEDAAASNDLAGSGIDGFAECAAGMCPVTFACKHGYCVPSLGNCTSSNDCPGDSYCDSDSTCVPYGVPPDKINDPTCT